MRNGFLGSLIVCLAGAGVAMGQSYYPPYRAPSPPNWPAQQPAYYNPYGAPPQAQAYPGWPQGQPMGAAYNVPYQGQPQMMPRYGPPMNAYQNYPAYPQAVPAWPTANQPQVPQMPFAQTNPGGNAVAAPTPPATAALPQPMMKTDDGVDYAQPTLPEVAAPRAGTALVQDDEPPGDTMMSWLAPPPPVSSHELRPPNYGPKGYWLYGHAEALAWQFKQQNVPPLVSTGVLGAGGNLLVGDIENRERYGSRLTLGHWLDPQQRLGIEVNALWLPQRDKNVSILSPQVPTFGNPILDPNNGAEAFVPIAVAGQLAGSTRVMATSELYGGELNFRRELCRRECIHLDLLTGFRYLDLREGLELMQQSRFIPAVAALNPVTVTSSDRFRTHNQFYGGQVGLEAELHYGRFFVDAWGKVALGANNERVSINGTTLVTTGVGVGLNTTTPGGVFAQTTNAGNNQRTEFTAIPEAGVQVGYQLSSHLRASLGYSILYIADVVRPGEQIDRTVNLTQQSTTGLVGAARPAFQYNVSEFWAHGVNVSLEFRY